MPSWLGKDVVEESQLPLTVCDYKVTLGQVWTVRRGGCSGSSRNPERVRRFLRASSIDELKEQYEVLKKNPGMEHADPNMVTLAAGKTGEVVWRFTKAGKVDFACLQPGHYDAGMKGAVNMVKAARK